MSVTPTAPGVSVVEVASGSRSIAGVSTSLTAFVGPTLRGPVNQPTTVSSWAEFQRRFGGLWVRSTMTQSVRHFFANGGSRALVVRVVNRDAVLVQATPEAAALADFAGLEVQVDDVGADTFDLQVSAVDADGVVLEDGGDPQTITLDDVAPGGVATAVDGATAPTGVALATVVDDGLSDPPPAGTTRTTDPGTGTHTAAIGGRATIASAEVAVGLVLEPTAAVAGLADFHHLSATVDNVAGSTFDLELDARQSDGDVVEVGGSPLTATATGLDVADPVGLADDVAALEAEGVALATVRGAVPSSPPADGSSDSEAVERTHRLVLAVETVRLEATDHGGWANQLRVAVDTADAAPGSVHLELTEVDEAGLVVDAETHLNVSTDAEASGSLGRVLELRSRLARLVDVEPAATATAPPGAVVFTGGEDGAGPRLAEDLNGLDDDEPSGLRALALADLFNLLCIPLRQWSTADAAALAMWAEAIGICEDRRAFLLVDPPEEWTTDPAVAVADAGGSVIPRSPNAALYFPRVRLPDPLRQSRLGDFPPCGVVAGVIARTDAERGVWKAPAGTGATLAGVPELATALTDAVQGDLNGLGISCLRSFAPYGRVVWGARTLEGADLQASEWKYVPVRRTALYLEESLLRGSRWAVFEPNGEALWAQLRLSIGSFMHRLYRQGAFAGSSPRDAYLVKCDAETTTDGDIDRGVVNVLVGFAPLRPAEFVIISLQQLAGQAGQ